MVQWLRLHSPNAAGTGLIPGQRRSRMPGAAKKKKKKEKENHTKTQSRKNVKLQT